MLGTVECPLLEGGQRLVEFSCYTFCMAVASKKVCARQQITYSVCCLLLDEDASGTRKEGKKNSGYGKEAIRAGGQGY